MPIVSVTQLNRYLASVIKGDSRLQRIMLKGEISNFVAHRSGHYYFSLRDSQSVIKAVMFQNMASQLAFLPQNGMKVIVSASVNVFERDGVYQLYVTDMQPDGVGAERLALEQRIERLKQEGFFDPRSKKPIPKFSKKIGVITSSTGAALQDILQIIRRRSPIVEVLVFPVLVQGELAPGSIARAFRIAENSGCGVLILGRGGGSAEDLGAFNTEVVARAIYACSIPVISAVGHETDITIADAVADYRVPTPSAAAEVATMDLEQFHQAVDDRTMEIQRLMTLRLAHEQARIESLRETLEKHSPVAQIRTQEYRLNTVTTELYHSMQKLLANKTAQYREVSQAFLQLDPLQILERGYAAVFDCEGRILSRVEQTAPNQMIRIRMQNGEISARVEDSNEL